jgi:hypothetical protein
LREQRSETFGGGVHGQFRAGTGRGGGSTQH